MPLLIGISLGFGMMAGLWLIVNFSVPVGAFVFVAALTQTVKEMAG